MDYNKPLYTIAEVAKLFHTNRGNIYKLHQAGLLRCLKLGSLKVRREEVERFLRESEGKEIDFKELPNAR